MSETAVRRRYADGLIRQAGTIARVPAGRSWRSRSRALDPGDPHRRRGRGRGSRSRAQPVAAHLRPARVRGRGIRDAVRRSQAAVLQLAADADPDSPGDVDLGSDARPQGAVLQGTRVPRWGSTQQLVLLVAITLVTAAGFYLNAVFAFAISEPGEPQIRPAFRRRGSTSGSSSGSESSSASALGFSAIVVPRWGQLLVHALPRDRDRRDDADLRHGPRAHRRDPAHRLSARQAGGGRDRRHAGSADLHAAVRDRTHRSPAARIARLSSRSASSCSSSELTLQAGATGAVKAIKMSAKLAAGKAPPTAA